MAEDDRSELQDILRVQRLETRAQGDGSEALEVEELDLAEMNMDLELYRDIQAVLNVMVRPKLAEDGGDLEVTYLDEEGVLWVRMMGGCAGCPSADETVKGLVEKELVCRIPQVKSLEIDDGLDYDFIQEALDTMLTKRTQRDRPPAEGPRPEG